MRARVSTLVLSLALAACHDDPEITTVFINVIPDAVAVSAAGGAAESSSSAEGTGGAGGNVALYARNQLSLGTLTTQPLAPTLPVPPTTGTTPASGTLAVDPDPPAGNLILSGTYTVSTATVSCDNGDIVVSGTLNVLDPGGNVQNLILSAPNGTVYITGAIVLTNTDGTPSGDSGGTLTVNASRVVVTGSVNASGESGGTTGGIGGSIILNANSGPAYFTSGTLTASGGSGTSTGGNAGGVSLTASQKLHVYGTILASGGAANGSAAGAVGGNGGAVTPWGAHGADLVGTITAQGGEAVTSGAGAVGGTGGSLVMTNAFLDFVPVRLYGRVELAGGRAVAAGAGGGLTGGAGGSVDIGTSGGIRPLTIETGLGTWTLAGGAGEAQGGNAGLLDAHTPAGDLLVEGSYVLRGGSSSAGIGGNGNTFDAVGGGRVVLDATVDTSGAASPGGGGASTAGDITLLSSTGGISLAGSLTASAGSSAGTIPQTGATILAECLGPGSIESSANLVARGGSSTAPPGTPLNGGAGGVILLTVGYSASSLTLSSGSLIVDGGDSTGTGTAGAGGEIHLSTLVREISITGSLQARGGTALEAGGTGGLGGFVEILTDGGAADGGNVTLTAGSVIDASGGTGTLGGNARTVAPGAVLIDADADNDNDTAEDGRISILGSILARGAAVGGDGGLVVLDGLAAAGTHPPATTNVSVDGTPAGTVTVQ